MHVLEHGICTEHPDVARHLPGGHNQQSHGSGADFDMAGFDLVGKVEGTFGDLAVGVDEVGNVRIAFRGAGGTTREMDLGPDEAAELHAAVQRLAEARDDLPEDAEYDGIYDDDRFGFDQAHTAELYGSGVITVIFGADEPDPWTLHLDPPYEADPDDPDDEDTDDAQVLLDALDAAIDEANARTDNEEGADVDRSAPTVAELREMLQRKFNPGQLRDPGGEGGGRWIKAGAAGGALTDALKLADRIDLAPDEKLVGSAKVDGGAGGARMALIERRGERMLRLGLGAESYGKPDREEGIPAWDGNPTRARLTASERQRLRVESDDLVEEDDTANPARQEQIAARLTEIRELLNTDDAGFNGTAELDEYGTRRLADRIRPALDEALEQAKVQNSAWDEIEALEAKGNPDPARMAELRQRARADDNDTLIFVDGVVPGSQWGDVHFSVELDESEPYVLLGVKPKGTPDDWGDDQDWLGRFDPAEARKFLRLLEKLGSTSGSASRAYSPESGAAPASSGPKGGQFALGGGRVAAKGKTKPAGRRPAKRPAKKAAPAKPAGPLGFDGKRGTGYGIKGGDPRVRTLQSVLTRLGFTDAAGVRLGANGKYGPRTTAAVKKLQKFMGLEATGKVDEDFIKKISNVKSRADLQPKDAKPARKPRARKSPTKPAQRPDRQSERQQAKRVRRSAALHEMDNGICRTCRTCPPPHILENGICTTC